jgi:hypothetical protein
MGRERSRPILVCQARIPIHFAPPQDDPRRAIPFMAMLAALTTLWARRARRSGKPGPDGAGVFTRKKKVVGG